MASDLNERLARLKAKRNAVEEAIAALRQLDAEYRGRSDVPRSILTRRLHHSEKAARPRSIAS